MVTSILYKLNLKGFIHHPGITSPRMPSECEQILHLDESVKKGDWFLSQDYTVLRIYGYTGRPYRLPVFFTDAGFRNGRSKIPKGKY